MTGETNPQRDAQQRPTGNHPWPGGRDRKTTGSAARREETKLHVNLIAGEWAKDGEFAPNINSDWLAVSRWPDAKRQAVEAA